MDLIAIGLAVSGKNNVFNVRDFGAIGDGITIDTSAIQAAFNAANAAGGGNVLFPNGIYLTDTITVYSNTTVIGANRWNSIVKLVDNPVGALFECSGADINNPKLYINFRTLRMQHRLDMTIDGVKGVLINGNFTKLCQVNDCVFDNFVSAGIKLSNLSGTITYWSWQIHGCIFNQLNKTHVGYGVWLDGLAEYVDISGNMFYHGTYGVYNKNSANSRIENNSFMGTGFAVYSEQVSSDNNLGKLLIDGNTMNHCSGGGIMLFHYTSVSLNKQLQSGCVITNNNILIPGDKGIELYGGYGNIISGNKILYSSATGKFGIYLHNISADYICDYNLVSNNLVQKGLIDSASAGSNNSVASNLLIA